MSVGVGGVAVLALRNTVPAKHRTVRRTKGTKTGETTLKLDKMRYTIVVSHCQVKSFRASFS
jgi:hypothetical protein